MDMILVNTWVKFFMCFYIYEVTNCLDFWGLKEHIILFFPSYFALHNHRLFKSSTFNFADQIF